MCSIRRGYLILVLALAVSIWTVVVAQTPSEATYDIGRAVAPLEISSWGSNIGPNGDGLPPGGATAAEGRRSYQRWCARCHGISGTEGPDSPLVGGRGSLASESPLKTVGSYWPFATTLWDYINRAMPFDQPGGLSPDEVYGSLAYVLFLNEIVGEDERLDASSVPEVQMPNRDGFVSDTRPDVP
mgnify:CR=1 FL=1